MSRLNASLVDIANAATKKLADDKVALDAANQTISNLEASDDPNITPAGIDAMNSLATQLGVPSNIVTPPVVDASAKQ